MLEFVSWFIWLGLFALLQRRMCRRYPGIRTASRNLFAATAIIAVLPGVWILFRSPHAPDILRRVNHYFGMGVYAQISVRALIELKWLALTPFALSVRKERQLMAILAELPGILGSGRGRGPKS